MVGKVLLDSVCDQSFLLLVLEILKFCCFLWLFIFRLHLRTQIKELSCSYYKYEILSNYLISSHFILFRTNTLSHYLNLLRLNPIKLSPCFCLILNESVYQQIVVAQQQAKLYLFMNINQSDKDSSKDHSKANSAASGFDSNNFFMVNNQTGSEKSGAKSRFNNPYRRIQIVISLLSVILATLWVQVTVQRHAPFVRTAQCFFNEAVFLHDSQDIYEGGDVIYWRNGEYYSFKDMQQMFIRLATVSKALEADSFFKINPNFIMNQDQTEVNLLTIYKFDIPQVYHEYRTYNSTIDEMQSMMNSTVLNRTFYEHLWKIQLSVIVPLLYRGDYVLMQIDFTGEIFSSMLMQFMMNVDILNEDQDILKYGKDFSEKNLGVRKMNNNHDMSLNMPYLRWIILGLITLILIFEMKFVLNKNKYIDEKVKKKIAEEEQLQKLLDKIDQKVEDHNQSISSVGSVGTYLAKKQQEKDQYHLPFSKKIQKIGIYFIVEVVVSLLALFSFVGNQNGLICFFCWTKIVVYLAQTKNRLMFGFLFEQTIPTYLRIYLNIILMITSFVLFNMLVLKLTKKFQTLELGYFEYYFNYFQYGIYQNFIFVFVPFGIFSSIFYFIQIMLLLYVGNNILISILANQVSKNSYLSSVEEMIDKIKAHCPSCGIDFQDSRNNSEKMSQSNSDKQVMVSKLVRELQLQKMRSYSSMGSNNDNQINILIKSPVLSPFFPAKNQKRNSQDEFLSPKLKQRNLKNEMKEIHQKIKKEEISSESKLEAYQQLKAKLQPSKKIHIQLSDSKLQQQAESKQHKKLRSKIELLFRKVQKFREIKKPDAKKDSLSSVSKFNEVKVQTLNNLLEKLSLLKKKVQSQLQK